MGKGLLWLRDNLTEVNLGNRVAVDRKALGGRIRLEGRCGGQTQDPERGCQAGAEAFREARPIGREQGWEVPHPPITQPCLPSSKHHQKPGDLEGVWARTWDTQHRSSPRSPR